MREVKTGEGEETREDKKFKIMVRTRGIFAPSSPSEQGKGLIALRLWKARATAGIRANKKNGRTATHRETTHTYMLLRHTPTHHRPPQLPTLTDDFLGHQGDVRQCELNFRRKKETRVHTHTQTQRSAHSPTQ